MATSSVHLENQLLYQSDRPFPTFVPTYFVCSSSRVLILSLGIWTWVNDAIVFTLKQALVPVSMAEIIVFHGKSWWTCHLLTDSPVALLPHVPMVFFRVSYGFSHGFHGQILPFSTSPAPRVAPLRLPLDLGGRENAMDHLLSSMITAWWLSHLLLVGNILLILMVNIWLIFGNIWLIIWSLYG